MSDRPTTRNTSISNSTTEERVITLEQLEGFIGELVAQYQL